MSKKKTKIMCNTVAKQQHRRGILIEEQLEEVNKYKYLGRLLTPENEMVKDIDQKRTAGRKRFGQYNIFMKDQEMPICLKGKFMNTVILPAMTYGAEIWSLAKYQKEKLAVVKRSMERLMLNITQKDKIRNEVVRSKIQVKDIIKKVQDMKGQWVGHLAIMNGNNGVDTKRGKQDERKT